MKGSFIVAAFLVIKRKLRSGRFLYDKAFFSENIEPQLVLSVFAEV